MDNEAVVAADLVAVFAYVWIACM